MRSPACLENGLVGQGDTKQIAVQKLVDAIASLEQARAVEPDLYAAPISLGELHEFLTLEEGTAASESYELRTVYG